MDDEQYGRYTVREAAIRLGLSEAAVRQRIRRHTLVAERSEGIVYVLLADDTPDKTADRTTDNTPFETVDTTPDSTAIMPAHQQLEVIRDTLLRPLIEQNERQQERIAELEREAGRITAERDQAQRDRDTLERRVSDLEAFTVTYAGSADETPQPATQRVWWRFWERS